MVEPVEPAESAAELARLLRSSGPFYRDAFPAIADIVERASCDIEAELSRETRGLSRPRTLIERLYEPTDVGDLEIELAPPLRGLNSE